MTDQPIPRPRRSGRAGRSATVKQALAAIADGSRVYVEGGCGAPTGIVEAMAAEHDRWSSLEIVSDYLLEPLRIFDHPTDPFRLLTLQPSRAVDAMRTAGALSTIPSSLRHFARLTEPDGRFSLGVSVGTPVEMIANAPLVIAEVNPRMPYTFGAGELDRDEIDLFVDADHPLVELPPSPVDGTAKVIGGLVAEQISDGSVLQFGVGAIPRAVLDALAGHRDLGIHGGMIGDTVIDLFASGALSGAAKTTWPGKMTVGAVLGSKPSFDFADRNTDLLMVPASISHGPVALSQIHRFVAINSAIEVALDGSINAETAGERVLSGPGGQPDYLIGAAESLGGKSVIALPATAGRDGSRSRIVERLAAGATVTVARSLADIVVTEFGVAMLRGRTLEQRAEALRAIAHPDLRADLAD